MNLIFSSLISLSITVMAATSNIFEPHQFFDTSIQTFSELNYVFSGRHQVEPRQLGVFMGHQNREWEYNWFLFAAVLPSNYGTFGFGYSNYGSTELPITELTSIGAVIKEYGSDTFESIVLSYEPKITKVNVQLISNLKVRRLLNETAKAFFIDIQLTSSKLFNNQVGIRTKNLIGTPYQWDGHSNTLPKRVSLYFMQPMNVATVLLEYDHCLNYNELSMIMGHISLSISDELSIFSSYRVSQHIKSLSFGTQLDISDIFYLGYVNQMEFNKNMDLSIHSINIGVRF